MAPEPGVLKRQRSRPSDWWAAKPSNASPLPVHAPVAVVREDVGRIDAKEGAGGQKKTTKRGRPSGGGAAGMKEVMGAGNRGRKGEGGGIPVPVVLENENGTVVKPLRRGRSSAGEAEIRGLGDGNGEGEGQVGDKSRGKKKIAAAAAKRRDNALEKPLRRGRSSAGETELRILDEASGDVATDGDEGLKGKKRGRPAAAKASSGPVGQIEAQGVPRRRGRLSTVRDAEQVDELLGEQSEVAIVPKRSGRISAGSAGKVVGQEPERVVASRKRSRRRSTGRVEDQDDELVDEGPGDEIAPKKRGRPPTAPTEEEPEEQLPKASRKPGRQPLSHTEEAQKSTSAPSDQPQVTKKRGRLAPAENLADLVPEESTPWNRRMRRPVADAIEQEANRVGIENAPARDRTRHRRSDVVEKEQSQLVEQERGRKRIRQSDTQAADEETVERRKRGTRRSDVESEQLVPKPKVAAGSTKPTKSSRRSEVVEVETASSKLTKNRANKRSKPSNNTAPAAKKGSSSIQTTTKAKKATRLSNATSSAPSQTHKKGSKRTSQIEASQRKRKGAGDTEPAPSKRQRIEKAPEQEQDREPEPDLLNYQHLEAVTRRVSRQTIEAKWEALPPIGIERISQLLGDLQRPVVARLNDERKKTQAGIALEGISRKLISKISRGIPFPPGTRNHREDDFDFEKILDHNRALEAQLTPTLHSNELLEAELSKEMARLESDMEILAELERNAKTEASVRNQAGRKLHSVLQPDGSTREIELLKDDIGLNVDQQFQSSGLGVQDDENLQALVKELDGHVDTIQGNIKQVQGISQAMANSKAAVQATLFDHLDNSQYDDVILGADQGL